MSAAPQRTTQDRSAQRRPRVESLSSRCAAVVCLGCDWEGNRAKALCLAVHRASSLHPRASSHAAADPHPASREQETRVGRASAAHRERCNSSDPPRSAPHCVALASDPCRPLFPLRPLSAASEQIAEATAADPPHDPLNSRSQQIRSAEAALLTRHSAKRASAPRADDSRGLASTAPADWLTRSRAHSASVSCSHDRRRLRRRWPRDPPPSSQLPQFHFSARSRAAAVGPLTATGEPHRSQRRAQRCICQRQQQQSRDPLRTAAISCKGDTAPRESLSFPELRASSLSRFEAATAVCGEPCGSAARVAQPRCRSG